MREDKHKVLDYIVKACIVVLIVFSIFMFVSAFAQGRLIINGKVYAENGNLTIFSSNTVNASDVLNPFWLNESDQRYNDTAFIQAVNQSLSAQIANLSFNGSDNDSDLYNQINSLNFTLNGEISARAIDFGVLYGITTTLNSNLGIVNSSLVAEIANRIAGDNALNQTIIAVNNSFYLYTGILNVSLQQEIASRIANDSLLQSEIVDVNQSMNFLNQTTVKTSGNQSINGDLNVSGQGFFASLGSSISKIAFGWFGFLYADNINATNISSTNLHGALNATDIYGAQWLLITDQRYNDTLYIDGINASLQQEILDRVANVSFLQSEIDSVNGSLFLVVQNINSTFSAEINLLNSSLQQEILDRVANDSAINVRIDGVNASLQQEILDRIANDSALQFEIDGKLNISDQRYNDSLAITNEVNARQGNDSFLQSQISDVNNSVLHNSGEQILNGNLIVNGNLSVIGSIVNLTVTNEDINGSISPQINGFFDLGSNNSYWLNVYALYLHGQLNASDVANPYWLNESDQRYNDTQFVLNQLLNYYTKLEVDGLISSVNSSLQGQINNKLDINDQRYNDTLLVQGLNSSLQGQINGKLDVNDQRYNDSVVIGQEIADRIANDSYIVGLIGNLSDDDSIYALNSSLANYLLVNDQRFNDTSSFSSLNSSLQQEILDRIANDSYLLGLIGNVSNNQLIYALNYSLNTEISARQGNDSSLQGQINNKLDASDQRYNDSALVQGLNSSLQSADNLKLNITDQRYNDTALINAINSTANIMSLGFLNSSGDVVQDNNLMQTFNTTANIASLGFNTTVQLNNLFVSVGTIFLNSTDSDLYLYINGTRTILFNESRLNTTIKNVASIYNDSASIASVNASLANYLLSSDQRYNDSALIAGVNTTSNIQSLGFNTTAQLDSRFYSISNPNGFVNGSGIVLAVGNWSADKQYYLNATADYQNDSASFYSINNPNGFINGSALSNMSQLWFNNSGTVTTNSPVLINNSLTLGNEPDIYGSFNSYPLNFISKDPYTNASLTSYIKVFGNQLLFYVNETWFSFDTSGLLYAPLFESQGLHFEGSDQDLSWNNFGDTLFYVTDGEIDLNAPKIWVAGNFTLNGNYTVLENATSICTYNFLRGMLIGHSCSNYSIPNTNGYITGTYANNTYLLISDQRYNDSALVQGLNSSLQSADNLKLNITDQRYNDTALINAINSTANIMSLGFLNSSGDVVQDNNLMQTFNTTANIASLGFNTTVQLNNLFVSVGTIFLNSTDSDLYLYINGTRTILFNESRLNTTIKNVASIYNDSASIASVNASLANYLLSSDQRYNDSALIAGVNTTSNIQSLGFNTTAQLDSRFYSISNPNGFVNGSGIVLAVGNWSADKSSYNTTAQLNTLFLAITDQRYNDSASIASINSSKAGVGNCPSGQVVVNTTTAGVQCAVSPSIEAYAEAYNSTSGSTITMTTQSAYYNVSGMLGGLINGWTLNSGYILNCNNSGTYEITYSIVGSVNNNDNVQYEVFVNNVAEAKSFSTFRYASGVVSSSGFSLLRTFNLGDNVTLRIGDSTRAGAVFTYSNRELYIHEMS